MPNAHKPNLIKKTTISWYQRDLDNLALIGDYDGTHEDSTIIRMALQFKANRIKQLRHTEED